MDRPAPLGPQLEEPVALAETGAKPTKVDAPKKEQPVGPDGFHRRRVYWPEDPWMPGPSHPWGPDIHRRRTNVGPDVWEPPHVDSPYNNLPQAYAYSPRDILR